jgi:hypothetical protein
MRSLCILKALIYYRLGRGDVDGEEIKGSRWCVWFLLQLDILIQQDVVDDALRGKGTPQKQRKHPTVSL